MNNKRNPVVKKTICVSQTTQIWNATFATNGCYKDMWDTEHCTAHNDAKNSFLGSFNRIN